MILIEDATSLDHVEPILGPLVPGHVEHPIHVGAYPAHLRILFAGALETAELALDLLADRVGHSRLIDPAPVLSHDVAAVLAELFLDGIELLAEQELPLSLVHAFLHVVADLVLERGLGQDLAGPLDQPAKAFLDVERGQDLDLALERQVRRVTGQVGQLAGLVDPLNHLYDFTSATDLEQVLDQRLVFARQHPSLFGLRVQVVRLLSNHPQCRTGPGSGAAHRRSIQTL